MAKGMPREVKTIRRYGQSFKVLAEEGLAGDWAAYAENEYTKSLGNSDNRIHDSGSKLSRFEAGSAFPDWEEGPLVWRD